MYILVQATSLGQPRIHIPENLANIYEKAVLQKLLRVSLSPNNIQAALLN